MSRLIDADVLIENLREIKTLYGVPMTNRDEQMIHWIIGHIKEQPTAYNVDKVVAELEEQAEQYSRRALELVDKSTEAGIHNKGKACSYEHAIDIVKRGGVE